MADKAIPRLMLTWQGDGFTPSSEYWARLCDDALVVGEKYWIEVRLERSEASHRQYFAALHDAWENLNEADAKRLPSAEHLRKWCLCKSGYCNQEEFVCDTEAEARKLAVWVRKADGYAVITVSKNVVTVFTAKSQSHRDMDKKTFEASKNAVLDIAASMIGTTTRQLHNARENS